MFHKELIRPGCSLHPLSALTFKAWTHRSAEAEVVMAYQGNPIMSCFTPQAPAGGTWRRTCPQAIIEPVSDHARFLHLSEPASRKGARNSGTRLSTGVEPAFLSHFERYRLNLPAGLFAPGPA